MSHKILIVDDEPNIVISLEFLMKKEGFQIAVAGDGEEGLAEILVHCDNPLRLSKLPFSRKNMR